MTKSEPNEAEKIDPIRARRVSAVNWSSPITRSQPHRGARTSVWAVVGLLGLRLAAGFEFLRAFVDKAFGIGHSTPGAKSWINGGSPAKEFLSGAYGVPFQSGA